MKYLRRTLIISIFVIYSNFFSLFEIKSEHIGPLTIQDILSLLVISYLFLELFVAKINYKNIENRKAIIWINWLIVFLVIVTLSMPFRGETLGNAFLISRHAIFTYMMVHLFIIDIIKVKNTYFIERTFIYFSVSFSIIYLLKILYSQFFIEKYGLGFAYIVAAFILVYWIRYFKEKSKVNIAVIVILFLGMFVQPFRAYAFSTIPLVFATTFLLGKHKKVLKQFVILLLMIAMLVPFTENFGRYSIQHQVDGVIESFTKDENTATSARLYNDLLYRIPMIIKSPYFGYGYVHPEGGYAKKLGFDISDPDGIDAYNLYSVDSGYLTFLTTFGGIGTFLILLILIRISILVFKSNSFPSYKYAYLTLFVVYLASTYTHNPLASDFGIIPLMILLALTTKPIHKKGINI